MTTVTGWQSFSHQSPKSTRLTNQSSAIFRVWSGSFIKKCPRHRVRLHSSWKIFLCAGCQGFEFNGCRLAVRYPDRIPPGMGISRSALRADNLQDETVGWATFYSTCEVFFPPPPLPYPPILLLILHPSLPSHLSSSPPHLPPPSPHLPSTLPGVPT